MRLWVRAFRGLKLKCNLLTFEIRIRPNEEQTNLKNQVYNEILYTKTFIMWLVVVVSFSVYNKDQNLISYKGTADVAKIIPVLEKPKT